MLLAHKGTLDEADDAPPPSSRSSGGTLTSSASGSALRYTRDLGLFLLSPSVTGTLVVVSGRTSAGGSALYDEKSAGLLALLDATSSDVNRLRIIFARRNVFVTSSRRPSSQTSTIPTLFSKLSPRRVLTSSSTSP